ncbi:MAG: hypothetical protein U9O56_07725 [Campylobacterota bacterium]|nr:hypothetical protein [Campylobacterota bacterium]
MKIEKLFSNLNYHKDFIFYLFEHRDKTVLIDECERFISCEKLEVLENFEIIERVEDKIFLDQRVISFLENYLNIDENIEVSSIFEIIEGLKHKIDIVLEYKEKQNSMIPQIRREIKRCDSLLTQNLFKLRIHTDRVYKNIDQFSLKIKELRFYELKLKELTLALNEFDSFLTLYHQRLSLFYNSELNSIIATTKDNHIEINKSLIPLTQDVCEYINKAMSKNIFIEKITKLKELKDSLTIKEDTNILDIVEKFDILQNQISIKTRLDDDIVRDEQFYNILKKSSQNLKPKTKKAPKIEFYEDKQEHKFVDIYSLHLNFKFSKQNLIEFLLSNNDLKDKSFEEIMQLYCKLILLYEQEYTIEDTILQIQQTQFKKIHYKG